MCFIDVSQDSEINNSNDAKDELVQSAVMYNMHYKDSFYWPRITWQD